MERLKQLVGAFDADASGATAIEYAVIACALSIVIAGVVYEIGPLVADMIGEVLDGL